MTQLARIPEGKPGAVLREYPDAMGAHDWEPHLPASPDGRLIVRADYCRTCGGSARFAENQQGELMAAITHTPADLYWEPGDPVCMQTGLYVFQNDQMEPVTVQECQAYLDGINPPQERLRLISAAGQWYQPLGDMTPPFGDTLRQHRWLQEGRGPRQDHMVAENRWQHRWDCLTCPARMNVTLDDRRRIQRVSVGLPARRRCQYLRDAGEIRPATDLEFTGTTPRSVTAGELRDPGERPGERSGERSGAPAGAPAGAETPGGG